MNYKMIQERHSWLAYQVSWGTEMSNGQTQG